MACHWPEALPSADPVWHCWQPRCWLSTGCKLNCSSCACVLLPAAQAQEGLIVAMEDADLLLLDGSVYSQILATGR